MQRTKTNRRKDKRVFQKTADRTHVKNVVNNYRGGIRL